MIITTQQATSNTDSDSQQIPSTTPPSSASSTPSAPSSSSPSSTETQTAESSIGIETVSENSTTTTTTTTPTKENITETSETSDTVNVTTTAGESLNNDTTSETTEQEGGQAGHSFLVSEARDKETVNTTVNIHETVTEEVLQDVNTQSEYSYDTSQSDNITDLHHTSNEASDNRNDLNKDELGTNDVKEGRITLNSKQEDDVTASVLDLLSFETDTHTLEVNTEFEELETSGMLDEDKSQRQEYAKSRSLKFPGRSGSEEEVSSVRLIVIVHTVYCS